MIPADKLQDLKILLDEKYTLYNSPDFIQDDPISIPHQFSNSLDIEVSGLFAAIFAWGLRKTIISKTKELLSYMDNDPHRFIVQHQESDLKRLVNFKHRTFNATDTLYFIHFLKEYYKNHTSLEEIFRPVPETDSIETGLIRFHDFFFQSPFAPNRTRKHIPTPLRGSTCKRLNMYLRWMVRKDDKGVDFGIWKNISPSSLVCPVDLHVDRVARQLGLVSRKQTDWKTAIELTQNLRLLDPFDPVKYDFALFGMGVLEKRS